MTLLHAQQYPRVLVFDSGVGGLTIVKHIQHTLPGAQISYLSDFAAFPYGPKPAEFLIERVHNVLTAGIAACQPDILVVACNTASTIALPFVRQQITLPIVGVVPAIKPAAETSQSRAIGLLATPGTVNREYTQNLINTFASDCQIVRIGSTRLVEIAEEKLAGKIPDSEELRAILSPFFHDHTVNVLDTIVLACTHFPLLRSELAALAPKHWRWLDSGEAIAKRVNHLLNEHGFDTATPAICPTPLHTVFTTAPKDTIAATLHYFSDTGFQHAAFLHVPFEPVISPQ